MGGLVAVFLVLLDLYAVIRVSQIEIGRPAYIFVDQEFVVGR